jgi:hypothetical protein
MLPLSSKNRRTTSHLVISHSGCEAALASSEKKTTPAARSTLSTGTLKPVRAGGSQSADPSRPRGRRRTLEGCQIGDLGVGEDKGAQGGSAFRASGEDDLGEVSGDRDRGCEAGRADDFVGLWASSAWSKYAHIAGAHDAPFFGPLVQLRHCRLLVSLSTRMSCARPTIERHGEDVDVLQLVLSVGAELKRRKADLERLCEIPAEGL